MSYKECQKQVAELESELATLRSELGTLRSEYTKFTQIYHQCPIGLAVLDAQRRFVRVNECFAKLTGSSIENHLDRHIDEVIPSLSDISGGLLDDILESGEPRTRLEVARAAPSEPERLRAWISSWVPLRDGDGEIVGVSIAVEEVTSQREAEARFRISQEVLRDGFVILRAVRDPRGKVEDFVWEYANPAALGMIDAGGEGIVGTRLLERFPGSRDRDDMFPRYVRVLDSGETTSAEVEYYDAGVAGWFRITAARIDPERIALSFRNITARKQAEQELRASERRLSAVLDNTRMAVFLMDEHQQCAYMNHSAEEMTGYSLEETRGRSLHDVVHHTRPDGSSYPLQECPIDRAFPEGRQSEGEEIFVHKDGYFYPVAFTASPIREEGTAVGTVIELREITRERADTERLRLLIDELNHRVKNTLSTIQSIFFQTMRGQAIPPQAKEAVMSRVMALSRSHDLLTERSWSSASFRDLVLRSLAPFFAKEDVERRLKIIGEDVELRPKPALAIAMGFHELATNAAKYGALSGGEGRVELSCEIAEGDLLCITWRERGGPQVRPPERRGFGRRLIEQGLAYDLEGEVNLAFEPEGVVCKIETPARPVLAGRMAAIEQ